MRAIQHYQNEAPEMSEQDEFAAAMITLSAHARVYWRMVIMHDVIWTYRVRTAATDGVYIYVNPDFFMRLPNRSQRAFLLGHEVGHIVLRHPQRGKVFRTRGFFRIVKAIKVLFDHMLYNKAADAVINADLIAHGLEPIAGCILDERFTREHLVDEVYIELFREREEQEEEEREEEEQEEGEGEGEAEGEGEEEGEGEGEGEGSDEGSDEGEDAGEGEGSGEGEESTEGDEDDSGTGGGEPTGDTSTGTGGSPEGTPAGQSEPTPHEGHDDHLEPLYEGTPEEVEDAERKDAAEFDDTLTRGKEEHDEAIDHAELKDVGVGAGMNQAIKAAMTNHTSIVSWTEELADVLHQSGSSGRLTYSKIHRRRFNLLGVVSPTYRGSLSQLAVIDDVSWSVDFNAMSFFHQEMAVAIDQLQPTNGTCVLFTGDHVEEAHDVYSGGELLDLDIPRAGGTYLSSALDWMEEHGVQPDITLAFTDGQMYYSDVEKLVKNNVIIILDSIPEYEWRKQLDDAGARYIIAAEELKVA